MSKAHKTRSDHAHSITPSSVQAVPDYASNDAEQISHGLEGRGAEIDEFGLDGGFAGTILECMPTIPALLMAKRFAHNPAVIAWADDIALAELVDGLSLAANTLLREIWPVGTGLQGETELAMSVIVGGTARGQVSAVRTDDNVLRTVMDTQASAAWEGVGAGVSTKDAFGTDVLSIGAGAGLNVHADIHAEKLTEFDIVSLIEDTALGSMKLSRLLHQPSGGLIAMLSADALSTQFIDGDQKWKTDFALSARGVAQAGSDQLLADEYRELVLDGAGVEAGDTHHILPLLKLSAEYGLTLRTQDGGLLLEGEVRSAQAFGKLASTPLLAELMGGLSDEAMSGIFGGQGGSTLRLVISDPTDLSIDSRKSGIAVTRVASSETGEFETEHFLSLATLSEVATTDLTIGTAITDTRKSVKLDLDPAEVQAHLSEAMKQVLALTGGILPEKSSLQLEGEAFLSAERVNRILGDRALSALERPQDLLDSAIDVAMGRSNALSRELAGFEAEVQRVAELVEFGGARLKGVVRQGIGGQMDLTAPGGSAGGTIRAAGGFIIDKEVDAEQVLRLRQALSGGQRVA